jgi:hypothetical protein
VNRLRGSKSWNDNVLGSALFNNRALILLHYQENIPSLKDVLSMRNQVTSCAYDLALMFNKGPEFFVGLLDPDNAKSTEQRIVQRIREIDEQRAHAGGQRRNCVLQ